MNHLPIVVSAAALVATAGCITPEIARRRAEASAAKARAARMDRSRLLIGAYCLQKNARTEEHVKAIRDCGVDFIIGVPVADRDTLDLFAKHGVGAIANGVVPGWWGSDGQNAGKLREKNPPEKYSERAAAFQDHPAIWAIDIGDEPSARDFPYYGDVVRQLGREIPGMPLYLNLYPNYASVSQNSSAQTTGQLGTPSYREYIESYCSNVPLDYLSYDFYPYMGVPAATDGFISRMYGNFIDAQQACVKTGRSFWYIPQVNSRPGIDFTTDNQLRFQAYAAMSFGAEAITWACWCKGWWVNNILDSDGKQTEQYEKLRRVNAELKAVGPEYMKFRNFATHFVGFTAQSPQRPGRNVRTVGSLESGPFKGLHAAEGGRLIVGEMKPRKASSRKMAVFVTAADDPRDVNHSTVDVVFPTKGVKAYGGHGEMPVRKLPDGTFAVALPSCEGVLLVCKGE